MCGASTFCERTTVDVRSVVRIDRDIPLDLACLVSCGGVYRLGLRGEHGRGAAGGTW
ncbi:hypothetical protein AB0M34_25445 [Nocardia sp. NPDC050193]